MEDKRKAADDDINRATKQPRATPKETTASGDIAGTSEQPADGYLQPLPPAFAVGLPADPSSQLGAARSRGGGGWRAPPPPAILPRLRNPADAPLRACRSCYTPTPWVWPFRNRTTGLLVPVPLCQDCYRNRFTGNRTPQHAQISNVPRSSGVIRAALEQQSSSRAREQQPSLRAELEALDAAILVAQNILNNPFSIICEACGHPSGTNNNACRVCNPLGNAPPQQPQIGNVPRSSGLISAVPEQQPSSRAREQQPSLQAELEALDAAMLVAQNILNNPFSIICEACGHPSGTNNNACRVCNPLGSAPPQQLQIGNVPNYAAAGAPRGAVAVPTSEQQFLTNLDAPARPILDNTSSIWPGPICGACGGHSGSNNACQACYNYAQTSNAGAAQVQAAVSARVKALQDWLAAQLATTELANRPSNCPPPPPPGQS
ncbi:uncharacterized protein [Triticum aestivum]|uniref:uncharacterized protein isoform X2 n=1 Tax=Triticum aestivum TaxID=4565 RepID=UPI001D015AD8|nr:uncharacterized protein LOC123108151 isoform X2 [Triticum aestivum]